MTDIERKVLEKILAGDDAALETLRSQARVATIVSREKADTAIYSNFSVPEHAPRLSKDINFNIGDIFGEADGLHYGFGALLNVMGGAINTLEIYSIEGDIPDPMNVISLRYANSIERDMEEVRRVIYKNLPS